MPNTTKRIPRCRQKRRKNYPLKRRIQTRTSKYGGTQLRLVRRSRTTKNVARLLRLRPTILHLPKNTIHQPNLPKHTSTNHRHHLSSRTGQKLQPRTNNSLRPKRSRHKRKNRRIPSHSRQLRSRKNHTPKLHGRNRRTRLRTRSLQRKTPPRNERPRKIKSQTPRHGLHLPKLRPASTLQHTGKCLLTRRPGRLKQKPEKQNRRPTQRCWN